MKYILLYKPPCGVWYVHSHKLYDSVEAARRAAIKFLHSDTPVYILPFSISRVENL